MFSVHTAVPERVTATPAVEWLLPMMTLWRPAVLGARGQLRPAERLSRQLCISAISMGRARNGHPRGQILGGFRGLRRVDYRKTTAKDYSRLGLCPPPREIVVGDKNGRNSVNFGIRGLDNITWVRLVTVGPRC